MIKAMSLPKADPEIANLIRRETTRQSEVLEMIPSENYASPAVREAIGSVLTNKYSEGYPHKRYYQGNKIIDEIEDLAISRAKALFGTLHIFENIGFKTRKIVIESGSTLTCIKGVG